MGRVGRGRAPPLHSSPQPCAHADPDSQKVTTPPSLAEEVEGAVEGEARWGMPAVRTGSRESRRSQQN